MNEEDKEELAKALVELIRKNPRVRGALWDCTCACPNVMVEY